MQRDLSCPALWQESLRASQERRIQQAAQEHHLQRARREMRERVGRRGAVAGLCGLAVMSAGAFAHDGGAPVRDAATPVYLDRGDSGAQVRDVQRALEINADGIYGPQTERSVRAFQERNGLQVDGIAGPVTFRALGLGRGAASNEGASADSEGAAAPSEAPVDEPAPAEEPAAEEPAASEEAAAEEPVAEEPAVEEPAAEEPEPAPEPEPEPQPASDSPSSDLQAIAQCESGGNPGAVSSTGKYRGKYQFSRETWRGVGGEGDPASASEAEQDRRAADLYEQSGSSPWPSCG